MRSAFCIGCKQMALLAEDYCLQCEQLDEQSESQA
jgi:hypothetical protein